MSAAPPSYNRRSGGGDSGGGVVDLRRIGDHRQSLIFTKLHSGGICDCELIEHCIMIGVLRQITL